MMPMDPMMYSGYNPAAMMPMDPLYDPMMAPMMDMTTLNQPGMMDEDMMELQRH